LQCGISVQPRRKLFWRSPTKAVRMDRKTGTCAKSQKLLVTPPPNFTLSPSLLLPFLHSSHTPHTHTHTHTHLEGKRGIKRYGHHHRKRVHV
jgi:hypothetical protein